MITTKNTLLLILTLPFLMATLITIGMDQSQQKKQPEMYIKIKTNPNITTAYYASYTEQKLMQNFGLYFTQSEPVIIVKASAPKPTENIRKQVEEALNKKGFNNTQIKQYMKDVTDQPQILPLSFLLNKKHRDILMTYEAPNGIIQHLVYYDTVKSPLTAKIKSDMKQFKNKPAVFASDFNTTIEDLYQPFVDNKILISDNGQYQHGLWGWYGKPPVQGKIAASR